MEGAVRPLPNTVYSGQLQLSRKRDLKGWVWFQRQIKTILDPYLTTSCQYLGTLASGLRWDRMMVSLKWKKGS